SSSKPTTNGDVHVACRRRLLVERIDRVCSICLWSPRARGFAVLEGQRSMNPNKALWEKGDFTRIAGSMRESGEAVIAALGITAGMKGLDWGCGAGRAA